MATQVTTDDKGAAFRYVPWPTLGLTFPQIAIGGAAFVALLAGLLLLRLPMLDVSDQYGKRNFIFALVAIVGLAYWIAGPVTRKALSPETGLVYHLWTLVAEARSPRVERASTIRTRVSPTLITRRNRRR